MDAARTQGQRDELQATVEAMAAEQQRSHALVQAQEAQQRDMKAQYVEQRQQLEAEVEAARQQARLQSEATERLQGTTSSNTWPPSPPPDS
jgi:hypothetical protein